MAEAAEVQEKKSMSTMKIVLLVVVLASIISGGAIGVTMVFLVPDAQQPAAGADAQGDGTDGEAARAVEGPPIYHRMDPKFVVSFRDQRSARFMQFALQVMTRDEKVVKQIEEHNPAIRSNLLLLFDSKTSDEMGTREGKEQFLQEITDDINASLVKLADVSGVEAAYFESFLIQ